jgi:hypothetical protein
MMHHLGEDIGKFDEPSSRPCLRPVLGGLKKAFSDYGQKKPFQTDS